MGRAWVLPEDLGNLAPVFARGLTGLLLGSSTNNAPFYYKIFYYQIISMSFCNITISHSSTPHGIVGEMFTLKLDIMHPYYYPTDHTQAGLLPPHPVFTRLCSLEGGEEMDILPLSHARYYAGNFYKFYFHLLLRITMWSLVITSL